jgi:hypothetical protein
MHFYLFLFCTKILRLEQTKLPLPPFTQHDWIRTDPPNQNPSCSCSLPDRRMKRCHGTAHDVSWGRPPWWATLHRTTPHLQSRCAHLDRRHRHEPRQPGPRRAEASRLVARLHRPHCSLRWGRLAPMEPNSIVRYEHLSFCSMCLLWTLVFWWHEVTFKFVNTCLLVPWSDIWWQNIVEEVAKILYFMSKLLSLWKVDEIMHFVLNILLLKLCINIVRNSDKMLLKCCWNLKKFDETVLS